MTAMPMLRLADGHAIPQIGYGVWRIPPDETTDNVLRALAAGYRLIDTAALYGNEAAVGAAIRRSDVPRDEVVVTTKVWNDAHGYDATMRAFDDSLERLGFDAVDLYLIHWPVPAKDLYVDTWRALEAIRASGRARSIGVSNFREQDLRRLLDECDVVPVLNQVELHPWLPQRELHDFHRRHGIVTQAWRPIAKGGELLDDPVVARVAAEVRRSPAQVVLRWHLQRGIAVIPKSVTPSRIVDNIAILDFVLDDAQMAAIDSLESGRRLGADPAEFADY